MPKKPETNVLSFLENKTNAYRERIALGMKNQYGWQEFTYEGLGLMSRRIASYLMNDLDIKREEKVAIISESKVEFGAAFFASIIAGTTFVPLDIKLTIHEMTSILSDCMPTVVFASRAYLERALKLKETISSIKHVILLDPASKDSEITSIYLTPENYGTKFRHRSLNSNALIIYTSGTTGKPKGVQTTFKNMLSQITDLKIVLSELFKEGEAVNTLSILPMNHLFELTVGFATFLDMGFSIYYSDSLRPKDVLGVMKSKKTRFMCTVPSFFKMLKMQFESDVSKQTKLKQLIFKFNYHYVAKFLPFRPVKKLLFKDIHNRFGNNFFGFISGGAPMDLEMGKYFQRIGINVYQGYGLSEASPVVSISLKKNSDIKSVGVKLNSFETKLDPETKELLVKGPSVMKGYYHQDELTKEVIDENGWLKTGDIAKIDKKGRIYITGRIKNMIVLPGGKKVFPEEVETALDDSNLIKEACVLSTVKKTGEKKGQEEVTAVVRAKDELYQTYDEKTVEGMLTQEVKKKTLQLTQYKRPTNIIVLKNDFPRTATRKIKRQEVKKLVEAR